MIRDHVAPEVGQDELQRAVGEEDDVVNVERTREVVEDDHEKDDDAPKPDAQEGSEGLLDARLTEGPIVVTRKEIDGQPEEGYDKLHLNDLPIAEEVGQRTEVVAGHLVKAYHVEYGPRYGRGDEVGRQIEETLAAAVHHHSRMT